MKLINLGASVGLAQLPNGDIVGIAVGQNWRLVSAMFLHAGLWHIAFNAYALWIFGSIVEQELGRVRFLLIYFVTGIVASAASYAFGPYYAVGVGASGAIFGIFGAFVTYNYRRRHLAIAAARLRWRSHARRHQRRPRVGSSRASTGEPTSAGSSPG